MPEKLISPFKEFGAFAGFFYLIDQALLRMSTRVRLYCYELMIQPISTDSLLPARMTFQILQSMAQSGMLHAEIVVM